jgi:hypothetical protein
LVLVAVAYHSALRMALVLVADMQVGRTPLHLHKSSQSSLAKQAAAFSVS